MKSSNPERWAPSSSIRERARLTHPAKPEPTVDDVLWYLDALVTDLRKHAESISEAFKGLGRALRGSRWRGHG